ncbi:hypothetical protein [Streptomyces celluloflavus]
MRIRAAIAASALAVTIVLGGASSALAGGRDHESNRGGVGKFGACGLSAGVIEGNPVFGEGCLGGDWGFWDRWR